MTPTPETQECDRCGHPRPAAELVTVILPLRGVRGERSWCAECVESFRRWFYAQPATGLAERGLPVSGRGSDEMTNTCCESSWHNGARVFAPWRVRGVVRTSDRFAVDVVYETRPSIWKKSSLFVCCDHHLAHVVTLMTDRHGAVVVTRGSPS